MGTKLLGTICPWGLNWFGTVCPQGPINWGPIAGDQVSGDHMRLGSNVSEQYVLILSQELFSYFLANFEHCDVRVRRPDGLSDGRTGGKDTVSTRSTICSTAVLCTVLGKQAAALHTLGPFTYSPPVIVLFNRVSRTGSRHGDPGVGADQG